MATRRPSVAPTASSPGAASDRGSVPRLAGGHQQSPACPEVAADEVAAGLQRVLESPHFAHAPRLSRFLRYVVEETLAGRARSLKEYSIAADVFGRGPEYDPATDALVRVEASRLRQKLAAYYRDSGQDEPWAIELPKGGYVPVFGRRTALPKGPRTPGSGGAAHSRRLATAGMVLATLVGGILLGAALTLGLRDPPAAGRQAAAGANPSGEAIEFFLKGRYLRSQLAPGALAESVTWFERAVERDPGYAQGWAALGEARATLLFHGLASPEAALPRAKADIARALSLSPDLAEARGVLARLHLVYDWDWTAADREFREAIALAPDNARLHQWFAFALASRRRFDDALAESRRAQQLDPRAYVGTPDLAVLLLFARRYDEALVEARKVQEVNAALRVAHVVEGSCLAALGRHEEAIAQYLLARGDSPEFSGVLGRLGYSYARLGRRTEALAQLEALQRLHAPRRAPATERAFVFAGLGARDEAFAALEEALASREGEMAFFDVNPLLDPLRDDPRFAALRRKAGL